MPYPSFGGISVPGAKIKWKKIWKQASTPLQARTAEMPTEASAQALQRGARARDYAGALGAASANQAVAGGAFGNTRAALGGGANLLAQSARQGIQAADDIAGQDIGMQLQNNQFNAGQLSETDFRNRDWSTEFLRYGFGREDQRAQLEAQMKQARMQNALALMQNPMAMHAMTSQYGMGAWGGLGNLATGSASGLGQPFSSLGFGGTGFGGVAENRFPSMWSRR